MKKMMIFLILLVLIGCNQETSYMEENVLVVDQLDDDQEGYEVFENIVDDIRLRLYVEKDRVADRHINVYATVEYIGQEDRITIHHGSPIVGYTLTGDGIDYCSNIVLTMLIESQLEKGKIYKFPFKKSGGYSEEDAHKAVIEAFLKDPDLRLPEGTYTLTSICNFDYPDEDYKNSLAMTLTIEKDQ